MASPRCEVADRAVDGQEGAARTMLSTHILSISHYHWYEAVFDAAVLLFGVAFGFLVALVVLHRHLADGFRHLASVSERRAVQGGDIYTAFSWPARHKRSQHRHPAAPRERVAAHDSQAG